MEWIDCGDLHVCTPCAALSPGKVIHECQNHQRNTEKYVEHVPIYGPSTHCNRPAIGRRFTTPTTLTHFPLAAGLGHTRKCQRYCNRARCHSTSTMAQERGDLTVGSQQQQRGVQSKNQESSLQPRDLCCREEWFLRVMTTCPESRG